MFKRLSPALVVAQVVAILVLFAAPGFAATETSHSYSNQVINGNLSVTGTTTLTGAVTHTGNETLTGNLSVSGNTTVGGTLGVTGAVTLTTPLTAANIQTGSAKRELLTYHFAPNVATGTAADGTTYRALLFPCRAGTVTAAGWGCITAPIGGTSTLKILKASSSGNTMLSTATVDPTTLTNNTFTAATLTGTAADLGVTATQGIYVELVTGTQTTDAVDLSVTIEFEPTDF